MITCYGLLVKLLAYSDKEGTDLIKTMRRMVKWQIDVCHVFEWKGNLTDFTLWNTGEAGDMHTHANQQAKFEF